MKRKTLGLALGAGSTKGFAHIGVLQALKENDISVDMIAGSSMGAIIGAIYAVGGDMYMLQKYLNTLNLRSYFDLSNPLKGGIMRGERMQELIQVFTHNKDFSQTDIPFICTAVDVKSGMLDVLEEGKLYTAVRASMSMPVFFLPVQRDGKTYIDGGVIERVPVDALKARGMDAVIGVDVGYRGEEQDVSDLGAYHQANLMLNIMMWQIAKTRQQSADIMLTPDVRQFVRGRFQMDMVDRSVEEGRRAVEKALPEIKALLARKIGFLSLVGLSAPKEKK